MPEEQTNPNPDVEANPAPAVEANPVIDGSPEAVTTEPAASQETESFTQEQIAEWKQGFDTNQTTQADNTRLRQESAARQQQFEQNQRMLDAATGREAARVDPLTALDTQIAEYEDAGYYQEARQLRPQRDQLFANRIVEQAQRGALNAIDGRAALGDVDANELAQYEQTVNNDPAERIRMLRLGLQNKKGNLRESLNSDYEAKEAAAQRGANLNTLLGEGASPGTVPGARMGGEPKQTMPWLEFAHQPAEYQQELMDAGVIITGAPPELVRKQ